MKITIEFESLSEMLAHMRLPLTNALSTEEEECSFGPTDLDDCLLTPHQKEPDPDDVLRHPSYGGQIYGSVTSKPATEVPPPAPGKAYMSEPAAASNPYAAKAAAMTEGAQSRPGVVTPAPPTEAPKPNATAATDFGAPPPPDEDFRRSVRAKLRAVNELAGKNVAKGMLQELTGLSRLPDVPLDKLEAIMAAAKAKEAELKGSAAT